MLRSWGISAAHYHGRLRKTERDRVQAAFMDGDVRVIAATNAFGLGVDKPDVRFVIHRDSPASLEAYYQEAGRARRDDRLARCVLIYRPADLGRAAFLAGSGRLSSDDLARGRDGNSLPAADDDFPGSAVLGAAHHSMSDLLRVIGGIERFRRVSRVVGRS